MCAVRALPILLSCLLLLGSCAERTELPENHFRIALVAPPGAAGEAAIRGAQLGAEEADRAATLVGRRFEIVVAEAAGAGAVERTARRLIRSGAFAIVGGFDAESCRSLAALAEREGIVFVNIGCRARELREGGRFTFHVEATDAMYSEAAGPPPPDPSLPRLASALWHPGLTRYGAPQLNDRFRRRFGAEFAADSWPGWMATKVLWESAFRAGTREGAGLVEFLRSDAAEFDGHKGESLRFDLADHQLVQPFYLVYPDGALAAEFRSGDDADANLVADHRPLDPAGRYALVTSEISNTLMAIDLATDSVVSTFAMPARPRDVNVSPDGRLAYVALSDDDPFVEGDLDGIAVVDLTTGVLTRIHKVGSDPEAFALSPDGRMLYASNEDAGTASILDLTTGETLASLAVGIEPEGVAISPDGRWVYVTAETSNTVSVIDTRINDIVASFMVEVRPRAAAFSPDGRTAYVTNEISGSLSIVDVSRHEVVETIDLHGGEAKPVGLVVSPDGRRIYTANGHSNTVSVIDAAMLAEVDLIRVGRRPWGIAISGDGKRLYTANGLSNDVSVVDLERGEVITNVRVGRRPWGVALTPGSGGR